MTFHGKFRGNSETLKHAHEAPKSMLVPLLLLGVGALLAGGVFFSKFMGADMTAFWNGAFSGGESHALEAGHGENSGGHHDFPMWVLWAPFGVTLSGFVLAWLMYIWRDGVVKRVNGTGGILYNFLLNKWYIDELYEATVIRATRWLGDVFWKIGDVKIIDGLGPNGFAAIALAGGRRLSKFQSGYVFQYALIMLVGVAAIVGYVSMKAGG